MSNRAGNPWFGDLVWVEGELLGRVEDAVAAGSPAWLPPAVRRLVPPPGRGWLVALGAGGTLLLLSVAVRTRSPRWGTAGAAVALVLVLGIACTPTGIAFYAVVTDHLGTAIALTSVPATGEAKVVWKASYAPFGLATEDLDPDGDGKNLRMPVRFPGQWWDYATNLHYNFFRDYDPRTGRYLEADPIGQAGGLNAFVYGGGDPANRIDPEGLSFTLAGLAAGGVIGAFWNLGFQIGRDCGFDMDSFLNAVLGGAVAGGALGLIVDTAGVSAITISATIATVPVSGTIGPLGAANAAAVGVGGLAFIFGNEAGQVDKRISDQDDCGCPPIGSELMPEVR